MSDDLWLEEKLDEALEERDALRARNAQLEEALKTGWGDKVGALRARVAQLEGALTNIAVNAPDGWEGAIARAALKDKP